MYFADRGIIPPKEWYHSPTLYDNEGRTVSMLLSDHEIIPPKEWLP